MAPQARRAAPDNKDSNAAESSNRSADVEFTGGDVAPIIAKNDDHIVLDLKNGHPCTLSTVLILFWYHLFVFSPLAAPVIYGLLYLLYRQLGSGVWLTWFLLNVVAFFAPPYYSR
jgi:hypothetical protein